MVPDKWIIPSLGPFGYDVKRQLHHGRSRIILAYFQRIVNSVDDRRDVVSKCFLFGCSSIQKSPIGVLVLKVGGKNGVVSKCIFIDDFVTALIAGEGVLKLKQIGTRKTDKHKGG